MSKLDGVTQDFLGRHTALSLVNQKPRVWRRIPYLKDNDGRAPPVVLAVGDRRRVYTIARKLRNPILLPETAAKLSNRKVQAKNLPSTAEFGRIAMVIGTIASIPVLVLETQMGSSATQIILNEVLSDKLTSNEYRVGGKKISLPNKVVIRIGTAGGINCGGMPPIQPGDVVNATHSIGATGAIMQSLLQLDFWHPGAYEEFRSKWTSLGPGFTITAGHHPRVECSRDVVDAIELAGSRIAKGPYQKGGNVTKDSLYAELSTDLFLQLCQTENCRTTEMELSTIAVAAHAHQTSFGMVSAVVGVLPDSSFVEDEKMKRMAEDKAVQVGLEAVKHLI